MPSIDQIINRQFKQWEMDQRSREESDELPADPPSIITVSRQHGSRGSYFAQRVAEELGFQRVHRQIIDAISDSYGYRKHIVESLDEKYRSKITMVVDSILTGQAVDHDDYSSHLCTVVLSMARLGGVVLVGRGGNFILGPDTGFHIRIVCPREKRVENLVKYTSISELEANKAIDEFDRNRKELMRKLFSADIDDPQHYDIIYNTGYVDIEEMVQSAVIAIEAKRNKLMYAEPA